MAKKVEQAAHKRSISQRLTVVKKLWINKNYLFFLPRKNAKEYSFTRNLESVTLWRALWDEGYRIPSELLPEDENARKTARIHILYSDLELVLKFSEERLWENYKNFLVTSAKILQQPKSAQKRSFKTAATIHKMSQRNDSPKVGASVRARMEFQKEAFGSSFKMVSQNAVLEQLASFGMGYLKRGTSYKTVGELNAANGTKKMPELSILEMQYYKDSEIEGLEFDILATFSYLGLLQERPIVSASQTCYEQYLTLLDCLDTAAKAFMNYCDAQSQEYTAVRNAWKGSEEGRKILEASFQKEAKSYDLATATTKPSRITPQRQNRIDLGIGYVDADQQYKEYNFLEWQKERVLDGKASFIDGQFVWNSDREEPTQHVMSDEELSKLLEMPVAASESPVETLELATGTQGSLPVFKPGKTLSEHSANLKAYAAAKLEYDMAKMVEDLFN